MKNNYNPTIPNHGFTHGGTFHADDVFSAALLRILNPDIVIERGFKVPDNFDGIVFDIGGGKYDHHETPRDVRIGGVPYAAFGKLWAVYGPQLVGPDQAKWLDETFIQPLDSTDNGGAPNPLSTVIAGMNPLWNQDEDQNACFQRAVDLAYQMLTRQIEGCESREAAASVAERAIMSMKLVTTLTGRPLQLRRSLSKAKPKRSKSSSTSMIDMIRMLMSALSLMRLSKNI